MPNRHARCRHATDGWRQARKPCQIGCALFTLAVLHLPLTFTRGSPCTATHVPAERLRIHCHLCRVPMARAVWCLPGGCDCGADKFPFGLGVLTGTHRASAGHRPMHLPDACPRATPGHLAHALAGNAAASLLPVPPALLVIRQSPFVTAHAAPHGRSPSSACVLSRKPQQGLTQGQKDNHDTSPHSN